MKNYLKKDNFKKIHYNQLKNFSKMNDINIKIDVNTIKIPTNSANLLIQKVPILLNNSFIFHKSDLSLLPLYYYC